MKCVSCNAEIPPQWVSCINENKCPGCGGAIMDSSSKELLVELREAMGKMPNDPEGLAGWLLSNYRLEKIGTAEPTQFHRKSNEEPVNVNKIKYNKKVEVTGDGEVKTDISVSDFFKRATDGKDLTEAKIESEVLKKELELGSKGIASIAENIISDDQIDSFIAPPINNPAPNNQSIVNANQASNAAVQFEKEAAQAMLSGQAMDLPSDPNIKQELQSFLSTINGYGYSEVLERERINRMNLSAGLVGSEDCRMKIKTRRS